MAAAERSSTEGKREHGPLWRDLVKTARYYLGGRRTLVVIAITAIAGGLALNWSWLIAAGLAPLVLALLACAAMCVLHLCMPDGRHHRKNDSMREEPRLLPAPAAQRHNDVERS